MKILAIDHGAHSGYTMLLGGNIFKMGTFDLAHTTKGGRFNQMYCNVIELIEKYDPCVVAGELPVHNRGGDVTQTLMGYYAMIQLAAFNKGKVFYGCIPTEMKKHITGAGNADKSIVAKCLSEKYDLPINHITETLFYKQTRAGHQKDDVSKVLYDKSDSLAIADFAQFKLKDGVTND